MKQIGVLLVALSALVFAGCTTQPRVETDHQADFDFSSLKTFDVAETKQDTKDSILVSPFTLSHIHSALEGELGKRYQNAATGAKPDFIVSYHVVIEEKIDPRSYDDLYGFGYYGRPYRYPSPFFHGPGTGLRVYNQGSLIIDVVDAKTEKPIWRGVSEKRLSRSMAPQQQREVLSRAVTEVIAQFPPVN
ncbi:DUF4136 domain-containing protein [Cellvibrio fibrivorans]|jgi:hypothetical protein|uniref:DUF4136 domain-containing protein n=1 Tax=Cellvibrio fibrivorans TaxID=126350 RepID=A0ABU1UY71_9GAMM|nr:DUF4136 domain-containing protein [Cellvibrio fibrivorans]MDR7090098.1 hypothetical protein [Cellvibrio fibrivorans]